MSEYIAKTIGVPREHARHLQKAYYRQFGTHARRADEGPQTAARSVSRIRARHRSFRRAGVAGARGGDSALPGRRLIFTNGSRRHAENVATKLGVLHLFEDICDIAALEYVPKPEREAFDRMLKLHDAPAARAAMFEDMPHNLVAASTLGMTTVLVHSDYIDHPAQLKIREWRELPAHIHYLTRDLTKFLVDEVSAPAK